METNLNISFLKHVYLIVFLVSAFGMLPMLYSNSICVIIPALLTVKSSLSRLFKDANIALNYSVCSCTHWILFCFILSK